MSAIRIENPCNENFALMTATERGSFCQKCSIDVYDFSKMNLDQIKLVIKENEGKHLCGRFEKTQLESLNSEFDAWKRNQPATFQSRFVFALLLVFGLTLFSCNDEEAREIGSLNSIELKAALIEPDKTIADQLFFNMDAIIANEMIPQIEYIDEQVEMHTMGELSYTQILEDTYYTNQVMVAGGPMMSMEYYEYLNVVPVDTVTETTLPDPVISVYNSFQTKLYPNPTRDQSTFSIYVTEPAQFRIEIYSITGQKVDELHSGDLSEGRFEFNVDLTPYDPGTYLLKVWSEKQEETVKILKVD